MMQEPNFVPAVSLIQKRQGFYLAYSLFPINLYKIGISFFDKSRGIGRAHV